MRPFPRKAFRTILFSGALFLLIGSAVAAEPRATLWNLAEAAMTNGLPKTAITELQIILDGALHDKAYAEAAKAMAQKITLESQSEKDANAAKVIRLEAALPNAPTQMRPILHTILALWYWPYFEDNRWRFAQRSATQSAPGNDFTTWDSSRTFNEIERQFQIALSADAALKAIPVSDWGDLLEKGDMKDAARPTLYDIIAREALSFYTDVAAEEPAKPENPFEISTNNPVFDTIEKFLAWRPQTADTNSPILRVVRLWQDLLRFHQNDPPPAPALSAADLDRLSWAENLSLSDSDASYTNSLRRFIQSHRDSEISSLARHREAVRVFWDGDPATAHRIAEEGERSFPKSPGGKLCHNLLLQIETKSAGISTELVWNAPWPKITVSYDNIDSIFFHAIPVNWEMFLDRRHNRPENLSDKERQEILRMKPALEWSSRLPPTLDYKETNFDLTAPGTLKPGFYFIAASDKPGRARDSAVSLTPIWVSDLSLVLRSRNGSLEGFVTEANSGEPIAGAEILAWRLDASGNRIAVPRLTSDTNGFFEMEAHGEKGYLFLARYHGQEISSPGDISTLDSQRQFAPRPVAIFYTDRSIYRPGQIVQFSGICFKSDRLLTGREVTVVFDDTNGKEIARQKCRANDYGSFAGSFTAPHDRLMGEMNLRAAGGTLGGTTIRVEEYKRPKFEVTLDPPKSAPKLNGQVILTGRAMGYSGAAVDGAPVSYRVARQSRMPIWWWHPYDGGASQKIAHGSLKTAADGSFTIVFNAVADPSIAETNEPIFDFTVNADVTDNAGETRSGEVVMRVGYTALQAKLAANDWETAAQPVALNVETTSLDDESREAQGGIKIYALQSPENIQRPPLNSGPPAAGDWPQGNLVAQKPFSTGTNGKTQVEFTLPIGVYQAVLETKDRFGKTVTAKLPVRVIDPSAASLGLKIPSLLAAPQWEAQPGDQFMALWGTGYAQGRACVEIEHRDKIIRRYWTKPGRTQEQIYVAVDESMRGGFTLHVTQIRENRAYFESHKIEVPWKNKELKITWEHFTSKLQPGQKESWTAVITGPKAERATAEMVATLYDESLDAFLPLEWNRLNGIFYDDNSSFQQVFCNNTESGSLDFSPWAPKMIDVPMIYRHFPPDLDGRQLDGGIYDGPFQYSLNAVGYINIGVQGGRRRWRRRPFPKPWGLAKPTRENHPPAQEGPKKIWAGLPPVKTSTRPRFSSPNCFPIPTASSA
ncbi:MAG TPA: MG2 domain-containing protein [Verrucomicrobiae bacterium]|jgi:hypothetical protein|nr:MG2 domain-containing protein [Verrucomicrobiae bacterium]